MSRLSTISKGAPFDGWALEDLLVAVGEAAYVWNVATDRLDWSGDAHAVFGLPATADIGAAGKLAALFESDPLATRREAVFSGGAADADGGGSFEVEYPLALARRSARFWIQDRGRWFAGPDGRPETVVGMVRRLGARHQSAEKAASLARFDSLTGQLSRPRLIEAADAALAAAVRMQTASAFVLASVSNLGAINEAYGFDVGDLAIVEASRLLRGAMRGGDTIGRFSTSTFGLVLHECDRSDLEVVMRRLVAAVHDAPISTPAGAVAMRIAVGGVVAPRHARDTDTMVARARTALRRAAAMPCSLQIYAPDPEREAARRANLRLADQLVTALNDRRVRIALQPVFDAATGEAVWSEALVRIITDEGEVVSGGPLARAAEEVGIIHMLDRRVLDLAVAQLAAHPEQRIAVNVSAVTTADEAWLEALNAWFALRPEIAERLMVEITETTAIADLSVTAHFIGELRARGVKVAIDDFGTGHTSFKALRQLAVDLVKIDGSFVQELEASSDSRAFVRALLALARELGFETVAEQVETQAAADLLKSWGATYLQGELLAAPKLA